MLRHPMFNGLCVRIMAVPLAVLLAGLLVPGWLAWRLLSIDAENNVHDKAASLLRTIDAAREEADSHLLARPDGQSLSELAGAHAARQIAQRYATTPGAPPYRYRLVALNPTNPAAKPNEYEASLVAAMAADPRLRTVEEDRVEGASRYRVIAAPVVVRNDACLRCHSTPATAPAARIREFGRASGYGWRKGQVVGASIVYYPTEGAAAQAGGVFWPVAKVVLLLALIGVGMLAWHTWSLVARPADQLLTASQSIRRGEWNTRFRCQGSDELSRLALSFQDTTMWLRERVATEEKLRALFQQFIPASVAARALGRESERILAGTRHAVTVMVINVRNFHLLQDNMPPDLTITTLNEVFAAINRVIVGNRGLVSKYLGDTVLAFFGMPVGNEEHTKAAVRAALEIPRALQDLYVRLDEEYGWQLGAGIGIATGEALVGHFGSPEHMEYTVLGDVVLEAHRLEDITRSVPEEDTICISEAAYRQVMSEVHVYHLGERSGTDGKPTQAYVVQGFRSEARAMLAA